MPPAGFEPTIPASERLQTHELHRAATEIGYTTLQRFKITKHSCGYELTKRRNSALREGATYTDHHIHPVTLLMNRLYYQASRKENSDISISPK
jgi:transposase-like protein